MPLSSILIIVLRLFSLVWLVQGVAMFATATAAVVQYPSGHRYYWGYAAPVLELVIAAVTFILSARIARLVTPPPDPSVSLGGLSQFDLYCFAFTFLGLYFVLSSIANALNWLHYFLVLAGSTPERDPQRQTSFYQLTAPLITLIAGGASLLFAPRCARKLTQIQRRNEVA